MGALSFQLALGLYLVAAALAMAQLLRASRLLQGLSLLGAGLGFCLHLLYILYRYFGAGHVPIASPHEATSFFAWCIFLIFFALQYRYRLGLLGAFVIPLGAALMVVAALMPQELRPLSPVLRSHWLGVHTVLAFLANASFALATGVGLMYLVQEHYVKSKHLGELFQRLPSLQRLDELNYRLITVGFPLFSLAIITGALWAQNAWGSYWSWDPREVWSLVTWLIFATVLHARLLRGWRGRRAALLTILGFVTILVAFFGIKLLRKGQHVFL